MSLHELFMRFLLFLALLLAAPLVAAPSSVTQPLDSYLQKPDGFAWKVASQTPALTTLSVTSQRWQGVVWQHQVRIYQPKKQLFPGRAVLQLTTRAFPWDDVTGRLAADGIGATFISVYDVPNQPIWDRTEDNLFGYSLQKMFETRDPSWSLAFPMAKSATRAMDAVQAWSKSRKQPITQFITIGFSKRGLGAWLASTDPRVIGLVSIGYNNLNVEKQAPNQLKEWGEYSPLLRAYTRNGLIEKIYSPLGQKLAATWDPYSFLTRLNKPKYLIDATNNGYWTLDALDQYSQELRGPTSLLYVANAGHYMEGAIPSVFGSVAAWCRATLEKKKLPAIQIGVTQVVETAADATRRTITNPPQLSANTSNEARDVKFVFAYSASRDFREVEWREVPALGALRSLTQLYIAKLPLAPPDKPFAAAFAEADLPGASAPLKLTSRVLIWDTRQSQSKASPR